MSVLGVRFESRAQRLESRGREHVHEHLASALMRGRIHFEDQARRTPRLFQKVILDATASPRC